MHAASAPGAAPALLREPVGGRPPAPGERAGASHELAASGYAWYVCAACSERLAREDWVLEAGAQHPLVFANPHGKFFELLLVSHVQNGVFDRAATTEFTWFAGYAWRIGSCAHCGAHIGWHFESTHAASLREFVALLRAAVKLSSSS
jgi:hypothetical protein